MRYVKMDIYFVNICKHEHEKNMKIKGYGVRLCLRQMLNKISKMRGFYFYVYIFGDLN